MKKIIALIIAFISLATNAQEQKYTKPDYKAIKKEVQKKDSPLFYAKLEKRFNEADSTMTLEERRHLYYGFIHQEKYSYIYMSNANDSLRSVLEKDKLDTAEFNKIIKFGDEILKENPFDLRVMNYMAFAYEKLGKKDESIKKDTQIGLIVLAILSSGDGSSKDNPFYVINVSHEYDMIGILGFQFGGSQSLIESKYDYLKLAKNDYNLEGFYFDISPSLDKLSGLLKD